jgi:hypothetical protein
MTRSSSAARLRWIVVALVIGAAILGVGTFQAPESDAQESGVSFVNESAKPVQVVTKFGANLPCGERPKSFEFTLLPGESQDVESGTGTACYCDRGIANSPSSCAGGWKETNPGSRLSLRLGAPLGGADPVPGACSSGWCDATRHGQ